MILGRTFLALLLVFLDLGLVGRLHGADFHVSAVGDDGHEATTPDLAWRTLARANRQELHPGDRLLLRGGDAFDGNLVVKTAGTASAAAPITIRSYGKGRATIRAGDGTGVSIENSGGIVLWDLIVEGEDRRKNRG